MTIWEKFGSFEYAANYCQNQNSKVGQESEASIFWGHLVRISLKYFVIFDPTERSWIWRRYFS